MYTGVKHVGRPTLRFKEVCKRDLKAYDINPTIWRVKEQGEDGRAVRRQERAQATHDYIATTTADSRLHLQKLWQRLRSSCTTNHGVQTIVSLLRQTVAIDNTSDKPKLIFDKFMPMRRSKNANVNRSPHNNITYKQLKGFSSYEKKLLKIRCF